MKKLLILTGPQGSGNHLMAKIFALHPDVGGWKELLERYWIGHDEEYFSAYWAGNKKLKPEVFAGADFWVTSISCPFVDDGETKTPDFLNFISQIQAFDIEVVVGIIVREGNIVLQQQQRVRGKESLPLALSTFEQLFSEAPCPIHFIDYEAVYLYHRHYLKWLGILLRFPVNSDSPKLEDILKEDANKKYITAVKSHWLDDEVKKASRPRAERRR